MAVHVVRKNRSCVEALTIKSVFIRLCFPERISLQRSWNDFVEAGASCRLLLVCVKRRSTKGKLRKSKQCECCHLAVAPLCVWKRIKLLWRAAIGFSSFSYFSAQPAVRCTQAVITPSLLSAGDALFFLYCSFCIAVLRTCRLTCAS